MIDSPALARISQFLLLLLLNQAIILCTSSEGTTYSQFWAPCRHWYSSWLLIRKKALPPSLLSVISYLLRRSKYASRCLRIQNSPWKWGAENFSKNRTNPKKSPMKASWPQPLTISRDILYWNLLGAWSRRVAPNIWRPTLVGLLVLFTAAVVCVALCLSRWGVIARRTELDLWTHLMTWGSHGNERSRDP